MPAAYWWDPITLDPATGRYSAADPENWLMGPNAPWDRYDPSDPAPGPQDHLYFEGGEGQADCLIPATLTASSGNAFAGMHLLFGPGPTTATGDGESGGGLPGLVGYWNTVTLADSFSVGALTVECGYISQGSSSVPSGNGSTLTVTSSLSWTGGTLNSNSVAGFINLAPGASGVAEPSFTNPGINGTVRLGSTLNLNGTDPEASTGTGSTLNMIGGTFEVYNNAAIVAAAFSSLLLTPADKPAQPNSPPPPVAFNSITIDDRSFIPKADGVVNIKPKSSAIIENLSGNPSGYLELKGQEARFKNNGTTTITQGTELRFTDLPAWLVYPYEQDDADAVTKLYGKASITSNGKHSVKINRGILRFQPVIINGISVPAKVKTGSSSSLVIGKDATLLMSDSTNARLAIEGGDLDIYGKLSVAINPRGTEASHISSEHNILFHTQGEKNPEDIPSKLQVVHRDSGTESRKVIGTKWLIATAKTSDEGAGVCGLPEMTDDATSADYAPKVTEGATKFHVERIQ